MPMHDWTKVDAPAFHDFRRLWAAELARFLNGGMLPKELTAATEPDGSGLGVRHVNGRRDLARVEIVSPAVKSDAAALEAFVGKVHDHLAQRMHLLILDVFPPGPHDPDGVHGLLWKKLQPDPFSLPAARPLVFAAYECAVGVRAYPLPLAVGEVLPDMPLFVSPGACFELPLEAAYEAAFRKLKLPAPA